MHSALQRCATHCALQWFKSDDNLWLSLSYFIFEVTMQRFKRNIDLTGDGGVTKTVRTSGEGKRPGPGSVVTSTLQRIYEA